MKSRFLAAGGLLAIVALLGCSDQNLKTGSVSVAVHAAALLSDSVSTINLTIQGDDINPAIVVSLTPGEGNQWTGSLDGIPVGDDRVFIAEAVDLAGQVIFSASARDVSIVAGQTTQVLLILQQNNPPGSVGNAAPYFESVIISKSRVMPSETVYVVATARDDDNEPLDYLWSASGGTFLSQSQPSASWTAPTDQGVFQLTVSASDPSEATATVDFSIEVGSGAADVVVELNHRPQVEGLVPSPAQIGAGESTALDLTALDPDGDTLTYTWRANCDGSFDDPSAEDPVFTLDANHEWPDCTLEVAVDDSRGGTNWSFVTISTVNATIQYGGDQIDGPPVSEARWRVVYFNRNPDPNSLSCPDPADLDLSRHDPDNWNSQLLFEEDAQMFESRKEVIPEILKRYCLYEYIGDPNYTEDRSTEFVDSFRKKIEDQEDPLGGGPSRSTTDVDRDSHSVTSMGEGLEDASGSAPAQVLAFFRDEFLKRAGKPVWERQSTEQGPWSNSRLDILDTTPSARLLTQDQRVYPYTEQEGPDNSPHGYTLWNMAKELLCEEGTDNCIVDVVTELALPYERHDANDPSASVKNFGRGGYVGMITNIAQAIDRAVDAGGANTADGSVLHQNVLNLALGWSGKWGGVIQNDDINTLPPHIRAVYHALQVASCRGAVVIASAGNRKDFTENYSRAKTPFYPSGWANRGAPSVADCNALMGNEWIQSVKSARGTGLSFPTADGQPLLWGATGVRADGKILSNAAEETQALFLAYADHGFVEPRNGENQKASSLPPPVVLTGSSVAALVVSATAAALRSYHHSWSPNDVMDNLYQIAQGLNLSNKGYGTPDFSHGISNPSSQLVSFCHVVSSAVDASALPFSSCGDQTPSWDVPQLPNDIDVDTLYNSQHSSGISQTDLPLDKSVESVFAAPLVGPHPDAPESCSTCFFSTDGTAYLNIVNPFEEMYSIGDTKLVVNNVEYDVLLNGANQLAPTQSATKTVTVPGANNAGVPVFSSDSEAYLVSAVSATTASGVSTQTQLMVSELMVVAPQSTSP